MSSHRRQIVCCLSYVKNAKLVSFPLKVHQHSPATEPENNLIELLESF